MDKIKKTGYAVIDYIQSQCRFINSAGALGGHRAVLREWQKKIAID